MLVDRSLCLTCSSLQFVRNTSQCESFDTSKNARQCYKILVNIVQPDNVKIHNCPLSVKFVKYYRRDYRIKYYPIGVGTFAETVGSAGMVLARQGFGVIRMKEIP